MFDFTPVYQEEKQLRELAKDLSREALGRYTHALVDAFQALIADCVDADVVFEPDDPVAYDEWAATEDEVYMPWTLGHVIVHTTASAEESAALAAELARGVPNHGRSRYEVPWREIKTIAQVRARLEESRRIRLASLEMWPDPAHLHNTYRPYPGSEVMNAPTRYMFGLLHEDQHRDQAADIVRQARAARK